MVRYSSFLNYWYFKTIVIEIRRTKKQKELSERISLHLNNKRVSKHKIRTKNDLYYKCSFFLLKQGKMSKKKKKALAIKKCYPLKKFYVVAFLF